MRRRSARQIRLDIRWGLTWARAAVIFCVVAAGIIQLATVLGGGPPTIAARHGISFVELTVVYVVSGAAGGLVLGLLRPIGARSDAGAALVGTAIMAVFGVAFLPTLYGVRVWQRGREPIEVLLLSALLGGPIFGVAFKRGHAGKLEYDPRADRFRLRRRPRFGPQGVVESHEDCEAPTTEGIREPRSDVQRVVDEVMGSTAKGDGVPPNSRSPDRHERHDITNNI